MRLIREVPILPTKEYSMLFPTSPHKEVYVDAVQKDGSTKTVGVVCSHHGTFWYERGIKLNVLYKDGTIGRKL